MTEQAFLETIYQKSKELKINPFLLLSGIEGLHSFKDVPMSSINYSFLDSLILTIFTLRIGDQFHQLAQERLMSDNVKIRNAAAYELSLLTEQDRLRSTNPYLASFIQVMEGKSPVRTYHVKALEVAALEINQVQLQYHDSSIGSIIITLCKTELQEILNLGQLFSA